MRETPDINFWFLRREHTYTKLKYSRTPAFDIISGGVAALFAGFLGFLICEKFGFELLDSGDFFMLFIYLATLLITLRLWIRMISEEFFLEGFGLLRSLSNYLFFWFKF